MISRLPIKINLNVYSYGYTLNFLNINIANKNIYKLVDEHSDLFLSGIELPVDTLFLNHFVFEEFILHYKNKYDFFVCFDDINNINFDYLNILLKYNIKNIRVRMPQKQKTIYGGNKHHYSNFDHLIESFKIKLLTFKSFFVANNMFFCIENHQDLHSRDLLRIIDEVGDDFIGINWDIGNSVSCCEMPDTFFNACRNYIKNIHLKDYKIINNETFISLVRCRFGSGFLKNFDIKKYLQLNVSKSLELGAQISRNCYIFDENYWISNNINKKNRKHFIDQILPMCSNDLAKSDYEAKLTYLEIIKNEKNDFDKSLKNIMSILN